MDYSQRSMQTVNTHPDEVPSHSLTYSSPVSSSGSQERAPLGLAISGCEMDALDQLRIFPTLPSQLIPEPPTFELACQDYTTGPCYPTMYDRLPNASEESLSLYSPTSMSASPSYNSALELGPSQDAFPVMPGLWMQTPCSAPTTPSEIIPITRRVQWDHSVFPGEAVPFLPVGNQSYAGTTREETGYSINAWQDGVEPQINPSFTTEAAPEPTTTSPDPKRFPSASGLECPECGKGFTRRSNCKEHQKMHMPDWKHKYPCTKCEKTFGRSSDLKRHKDTVHLGIRKYSCKACDRRFSRQDSLNRHECEIERSSGGSLVPRSPQRMSKLHRSLSKS